MLGLLNAYVGVELGCYYEYVGLDQPLRLLNIVGWTLWLVLASNLVYNNQKICLNFQEIMLRRIFGFIVQGIS